MASALRQTRWRRRGSPRRSVSLPNFGNSYFTGPQPSSLGKFAQLGAPTPEPRSNGTNRDVLASRDLRVTQSRSSPRDNATSGWRQSLKLPNNIEHQYTQLWITVASSKRLVLLKQ